MCTSLHHVLSPKADNSVGSCRVAMQRHAAVPCCSATLQCHAAVLCCSAVLQCPCCSAMLQCRAAVPRCHVTLQCHAAVPRCSAMLQCHAAVPCCSAMPQCHHCRVQAPYLMPFLWRLISHPQTCPWSPPVSPLTLPLLPCLWRESGALPAVHSWKRVGTASTE